MFLTTTTQMLSLEPYQDLFKNEKPISFNDFKKFIDKDGNCMYAAISYQYYGTTDHHKNIRNKIVNYMFENMSDFEPYIVFSDENILDTDKDRVQQWINKMYSLGTWATEICVRAACKKLDINIIVFNENTKMYSEYKNNDNEEKIFLIYNGHNHYDTIVHTRHKKNKDFKQIEFEKDLYKTADPSFELIENTELVKSINQWYPKNKELFSEKINL